MSTDLSAHDVLCAAKAKLMRDGWTRGRFEGRKRSTCLRGALTWADGVPHLACLRRDVMDAMWAATDGWTPIGFNDAPGRTFEEIIAALDRAILATAPKPSETPETTEELVTT